MKKTVLIIWLCLAFISCGKSDEQTSLKNEEAVPFRDITLEINILTSDSLRLSGRLIPSPDTGRAPLFVLLPMLGHTHESYQPFIDSLKNLFAVDSNLAGAIFPHLLSLDLRGHGQSILKGGDTLNFETMSDADYQKIPQDVVELLTKIMNNYRDRIDTSRITLVGASIGANAALISTLKLPFVSKVVMLSPGNNYHSLVPDEAFINFEGKIFMATSRADKYSYETVQHLAALKNKNWILKIYPRDGHGTDILKFDIAMRETIMWLFENQDN